ncbi:hypothetical protein ACOMHN_036077 [Nucella lapillus]
MLQFPFPDNKNLFPNFDRMDNTGGDSESKAGPSATSASNNGGPSATTTSNNRGPSATTTSNNRGPSATTKSNNGGPSATTTFSNGGPLVTTTSINRGPSATTKSSNEGPLATTRSNNGGPLVTTSNGTGQKRAYNGASSPQTDDRRVIQEERCLATATRPNQAMNKNQGDGSPERKKRKKDSVEDEQKEPQGHKRKRTKDMPTPEDVHDRFKQLCSSHSEEVKYETMNDHDDCKNQLAQTSSTHCSPQREPATHFCDDGSLNAPSTSCSTPNALSESLESSSNGSSDPNTWKTGDLLWGRLTGHPWWPCIVCEDANQEYIQRHPEKPTVKYHVQYLDKDRETSWLTKNCLKKYEGKEKMQTFAGEETNKVRKLKSKLRRQEKLDKIKNDYGPYLIEYREVFFQRDEDCMYAVEKAEKAKLLTREDRLDQYVNPMSRQNPDNPTHTRRDECSEADRLPERKKQKTDSAEDEQKEPQGHKRKRTKDMPTPEDVHDRFKQLCSSHSEEVKYETMNDHDDCKNQLAQIRSTHCSPQREPATRSCDDGSLNTPSISCSTPNALSETLESSSNGSSDRNTSTSCSTPNSLSESLESSSNGSSDPNTWKTGDLLWGCLTGHPWWPCIVYEDANREYIQRYPEKHTVKYHVQYLDKDRETSWLTKNCLKKYKGKEKMKTFARKETSRVRKLKSKLHRQEKLDKFKNNFGHYLIEYREVFSQRDKDCNEEVKDETMNDHDDCKNQLAQIRSTHCSPQREPATHFCDDGSLNAPSTSCSTPNALSEGLESSSNGSSDPNTSTSCSTPNALSESLESSSEESSDPNTSISCSTPNALSDESSDPNTSTSCSTPNALSETLESSSNESSDPNTSISCSTPNALSESLESSSNESSDPNTWKTGDLLWGRLTGHPWWPCIVCEDANQEYIQRHPEKPTVKYHVQYLDKDRETSWLTKNCLKKYEGKEKMQTFAGEETNKVRKLKSKLRRQEKLDKIKNDYGPYLIEYREVFFQRDENCMYAVEKAEKAKLLTREDRLDRYVNPMSRQNPDNPTHTRRSYNIAVS